jgi:hypothetical protein
MQESLIRRLKPAPTSKFLILPSRAKACGYLKVPDFFSQAEACGYRKNNFAKLFGIKI